MRPLYVYALVPAGLDGLLGAGLSGEALQFLPLGPLAAVAGPMDSPPSIAPATLRAHDDVVRNLARVSDAILPFRFGAMVYDANELAEGLAPRLGALGEALERTRGRDQMTLRLYADGGAGSPAGGGLGGPGTRWLRERSSRSGSAMVELGLLREALAEYVHAEVIEHHDAPPLRASIFHLAERSRTAEYGTRVQALAHRLAPARVATSGPWPPYAFAELE
jgi:hypothetical protein